MTMMEDDREALASEYVLGTLDADERAQADALMLVDASFVVAVRRWERRLGELNVLVSAVEPPAAVWDRIKTQLPNVAPSEHVRLPAVEQPKPAEPEPSADVIDLTQRMRRWRGLTVMTGALAACLIALLAMREVRPDMLPAAWRPVPLVVERVVEKPVEVVKEVVREVPSARPAQFVAVFQKDEQSPAFVLSVDTDKREVTVKRVAAERLTDKSYELWIKPEQDPNAHSLGVIADSDFPVRAMLANYDPEVILKATFGISEEERDGSKSGKPSDKAMHAKLLQVTPPNP